MDSATPLRFAQNDGEGGECLGNIERVVCRDCEEGVSPTRQSYGQEIASSLRSSQ